MAEKLLTLFTTPKPFKDPHIITIQRNALRSWQALGDEVEVLVIGNDEGVAENTRELGVRHIPEVRCNTHGTPLISSMLEQARANSDSPYLAIINTDIILFPDILKAVRATANAFERFVMIGQRWDMDVTSELAAGAQAFAQFKKDVKTKGNLHPPMGSDYFLFPRECYASIPDFAIGRAGWDNWFIFKSRWEGWKLVDATKDVTIVHQSHDYRHLPGGQAHYRLPETEENVEQAGGYHTIFTMADAQYNLVKGRVERRPLTWERFAREVEIFPLTGLHSHFLGKLSYFMHNPRKAYLAFRRWLQG
ncbi:hypothetical protein [Pelolinea submarina]|uniref:GT2 family glycosyltransferase n=1 Tax=Pelolinea submarina TaxID=913107 RepID=A0A347ZVV1_9CHLR|nr:hypothetical protein [Pelolinea submarina]REG07128.1 hypothetical protein DFR64_2332 [Pelolinea submarina]BBB49432.1 hypothetical protein Pelsub_P2663 [Pelolinea submarina]